MCYEYESCLLILSLYFMSVTLHPNNSFVKYHSKIDRQIIHYSHNRNTDIIKTEYLYKK